jgi:hypothetical protein
MRRSRFSEDLPVCTIRGVMNCWTKLTRWVPPSGLIALPRQAMDTSSGAPGSSA